VTAGQYSTYLVRFSSFKVCCFAGLLPLDYMYMKIIRMEPENQEKYGNGNNNEIERKLKDTMIILPILKQVLLTFQRINLLQVTVNLWLISILCKNSEL
jgi:hypothetical protein